MKKKLRIITMILFTLVIMTGCSAKGNPEQVVSEFVEAIKVYDLELMASKISPEDQEGRQGITNLKEDQEETDNKMTEYVASNAKKITHEIKETKIDGDLAIVVTEFKYVDGGPIFVAALNDYMEASFASMLSEDPLTQEQLERMLGGIITEKREEIEETFTEKTVEIQTIKIDGQWYIHSADHELLNIILSNLPAATDNL